MAAATNPLETYGCGNNNGHTVNNNVGNNAMMALKNPTMMTQTQTRARVREIETCCKTTAPATATAATCSSKALTTANNECHFHGKQLEQKKFHLTKNNNEAEENNNGERNHKHNYDNDGNNVDDGDVERKHKAQGFKGGNRPAADYNRGKSFEYFFVFNCLQKGSILLFMPVR